MAWGLFTNKEGTYYQKGALGPGHRQWLPEGMAGPVFHQVFSLLKMPKIYSFKMLAQFKRKLRRPNKIGL